MRIAIFGTGEFFKNHYKMIRDCDEVISITDNNSEKWGEIVYGYTIQEPNSILLMDYDIVLLMVNRKNASIIRRQLILKGVRNEQIWFWVEYQMGEKTDYAELKGDILIISPYLNYVGGIIAEINASRALMDEGKKVTILACDGNIDFINEHRNSGFDIQIIPYLDYNDDKFDWIENYEQVIVNVFQLFEFVKTISYQRRLIWWLHEPSEFYEQLEPRDMKSLRDINFQNVRVMAVSKIAKRNFLKYTNIDCEIGILHYGIPDKCIATRNNENTINIAIIGTVYPTKGQDIFLNAIEKLSESERKQLNIWIIGSVYDDEYGLAIKHMAMELGNITLTGQVNRRDIERLEYSMDVIVSSSREDCLPIVIAEGLMLGKVCIVSSNTGFKDYITNYINGMIFKSECVDELTNCIRWILEHRGALDSIGNNGRRLYDEVFSMCTFTKHLQETLIENVNRR